MRFSRSYLLWIEGYDDAVPPVNVILMEQLPMRNGFMSIPLIWVTFDSKRRERERVKLTFNSSSRPQLCSTWIFLLVLSCKRGFTTCQQGHNKSYLYSRKTTHCPRNLFFLSDTVSILRILLQYEHLI